MFGFLRSRETKFIEENAGKLDAISEDMAANIFVRDILVTAKKSWANVKGELATMTSVAEIDDRMGPFDFALAGMAVQMQAPRNLFARDRQNG